MKRVFAIGAVVGALSGCGTVQNFQRGSVENATVYGGVDIAAERLNGPPQANSGVASDTLDVALSAVGDTITLPITVCAELVRAVTAAYFTPERPPPNPPGAQATTPPPPAAQTPPPPPLHGP